MIKQKYTADDIKKIYEKSLPKVYQAPYKEPVGIYKPAPVEVEKQNSLIGNVLQPFKNIQANYVVGDLGETERKAWSAYRAKQDAESLKAAQKATAETEKYAMANRNVGQGNIVTKDFAQYLPQMKNQIISGLGGAGERAVLGAGAGAGMALLAGQAGPQVLTPEEIVTVPAGAVAGGVMGGKAGYMEGVARYSYNQMAGAAYKNLLDLGVPNDIAIKVSGDEALISSLIESAGAGVDIATVGIGKLFSKAPKDAVVKTAKNRLVSALKAYGINILSEAMEEGSQEIVSIQSEKRALKKAGMPERDVTPEEDIARILEAARGGAAVATVSGGLNVAGNIATNAIYNNQIRHSLPTQEQQTKGKVKIEDIIKQNKEVTQEQTDGRVLPTVNTNKQVDQSIEQVSNVAQKANRGVTDNIQQRQGQIVENVADTDIKISPKYRNKFIRSVSDALGVSKYSNKANINSLSDMLVEEIARGNNIDAQSAEILFNTLMDEGVSVDSEFYNLYKDLKNEIKNTRLYVGDDVRAEYGRGEYNNFKKAHFGKLNLTSDRSNMSVDQYYQELSGRYPELFPESIIVQQDQLGRIADVVNSIVKNEDKLSSLAQNDKEYRQFARAEFDKAINNLKEEVKKETVRKLPTKQEQIVAESQRTLPVKEKKTGIQIDDSSENVRKKNPHVYKYIDKLGESVGVKVKFVPEYSFDVKLDDGTVQRNEANGYYNAKENTIVISEGASNPAMVVAKHELTHLMENRSPELYKEYKDYVIDSMKKKGTYQAEVDKLSEAYKGVLSSKDLKAIEDEIVSNASELYLEGDRQSIQDIIDYSPSIAQRVHEFIKNIIDKIKTAMGKDTGAMNISQFRQAEKLWAEMLDDTIRGNAEQSFYENNDVKYSLREEEAPKKTITAYKLFRIDDKTGKLYPLFVSANEEIPQGVWLNADEGERAADTKSGAQKVKSKLGALAYRPGWHSGDIPLATHIGVKGKSGNIEFMNPNHVWAEVEVSADKSYQGEANANGVNPKTRKINYVKADIKKIPVDGYYRYKTNPNMTGEWIISGAMKVNRILSDSEAAEIVRKAGYEPLPRMANEVKVETKQDRSKENVAEYSTEGYNNIKEALQKNHKEYKNNKEVLSLAAKAIEDLQKIKYQIPSAGREMDRNTSGIRKIADGISREFINKGYVELKGRKINSLEELAVLCQVFRDPRFETFRTIYMKNNKIVAHEAISSRMPGMSSAFLNMPKRSNYMYEYEYRFAMNDWYYNTRFDDMKDRMKRLKADGYYLLHNHPSGVPDASSADIKLTQQFKDNVDGFKGHVIINSNQYGWLEMGDNNSCAKHVEDMEQPQIELFLKPTVEHPLLNESVTSPEEVAAIAKSLETAKEKSALIYVDSKGHVRGIEEIPNGMTNDSQNIKGFVRNRSREFGSGMTFLSTSSKEVFDMSANLIEEKYLRDSLLLVDDTFYSHSNDIGTRQDPNYAWAGIKENEIDTKTSRVNEDTKVSLKEQPDDIKASMKKANKKLPTKSQQSILNDAAMRIQEAKKVIEFDDDIAEVLTSSKQKQLPRKSAAINTVDAFKRKFVDSGNTIAKVAKITNDSTLYTMFNNAKQSRQAAEYMIGEAQTDVMGNKVGDSLKNIFDPIRKKGNDYYKKFSEYMFHLHNIDRMAQGKPVFGESVTAEMSQVKVNEFEYSNPEFIKYAAKVHEYNQNLMQYRIDTGLVSVEQANIMNEMYPNYVPTYRKNAVSTGARGGSGRVEITQGIKKATGSSKDLLPLHEQMARQTMQVVQAGKRNLFGNRLLSDTLLNRDSLSEYIQAVTTEKADIDIDEMTAQDLRNSFTIYNNGEKTTMKLNTGLYEGVKSMASEGREITAIEKAAKAYNNTFKKLVTGYNPMFTIRNIARDLQDAGIYSKDLTLFAKNFPIAYKEIITNGKKWQQYQALGGFGSSIFDYERGYKQEIRDTGAKKVTGFVKDNTFKRIEDLNFVTEQAPRFAEFLATLEKGNGSYENLMEAMYNSADVTVNFGKWGTWGKVLNSTFVPFFNPAVQGTSKFVRMFQETKGVKQWTKLVIKAAALGIAPSIINSMLYDDDDEFDKIHNRDKDINFLLKIGDDQWVKIPKGRVLSLFGNAAQRTLRTIKDEEDAWAGFISTSADSILPMNPFTNNIVSPLLGAKFNTTWYGTPIEGQGLQAFKPGERFDTRTDSFSIWLGKRLNYSPKKINYLLDAYTGVIGDFALPLMSKKAETNAFKKQFVLDSTLSNKVSTTFYSKIDDLTYEKNSIEEDNVYDVVYRFMNKQRTAVSDLNREIKAIENSDLSNNEQKTKVKEITAIKNGIQLNALDALEEYQKAAEKNFKKFDNDVDNAYLYTNKDMFGAEYALKTYNKNIYQKYLDSGQSAEKYFEEYFTELFAKREAKAAKEASAEVKIKLPTIKTIGSNTKLPTIKNK